MLRLRRLGFAATTLVLALDQGVKLWLLHGYGIEGRPPLRLLPVLDLVLAWNKGVSYSLFSAETAAGRAFLLAIALIATVALAIWLWRATTAVTAIGLGCIIGGALGNAIDRTAYGAVVDFFYFHTPFSLGPLSNYVFNLADVGIVAGVCLILYDSLLARGGETPDQSGAAGATESPKSAG